jgi:hypothetical protein
MKWHWATYWFGWLCIVFPWSYHPGELRFRRCALVSHPRLGKIFWKELAKQRRAYCGVPEIMIESIEIGSSN